MGVFDPQTKRTTSMMISIEYEDGGSEVFEFGNVGVTVTTRIGSPKAQMGGIAIETDYWPMSHTTVPPLASVAQNTVELTLDEAEAETNRRLDHDKFTRENQDDHGIPWNGQGLIQRRGD